MVSSRKEIRDHVLDITRQNNAQIGDLVNSLINLTIDEIGEPSWAFPRKNHHHLWSFLRRKTSFTTTASTSNYVLGRDIDKIALIRQTESPIKLRQIRDEDFFEVVPDPTSEGNPRWYRLWETEGVSTQLTADDTIDVVSDSSSDSGDSSLQVSVSGYDTDGIWRTETYQLNGTSTVSGSVTFDGGREIIVTKQQNTTGKITVTENSGGTTLVVLGPEERAPKFKVIDLYPIPSSAISIFVEYYTRIPALNNDSDVPLFDEKWHYVVQLGTLEKVYGYLNKEEQQLSMRAQFASAVRSMVASDKTSPDLVEHLKSRRDVFPFIHQRRTEDAIA